ncbi:hypothetical protein RchiOBHm_Chr3g0468691 [Rosa chinensis]|uniref:Uncharacterized protein n=1 Tax=Rosa chinensis TaxID=74649 RepID=A0A2P6RAK9_ROSCH|nr:hypothetical protein RchiOBHm_Chr3g0468691 [Rosa chinensis]
MALLWGDVRSSELPIVFANKNETQRKDLSRWSFKNVTLRIRARGMNLSLYPSRLPEARGKVG